MIGLNDTQPKLREAAQVLRLPPHLLLTRLIAPTALPSFMTGLRLALAQAWVSQLVVELLASSEGIGYLMVWARQLFMLDIVFVCIAVIALMGMVMDRSLRAVDHALIRWPRAATAELTLPRASGLARLLPWLLPIASLLLWQIAASNEWVDPNLLPAPTAVVSAVQAGADDGSLVDAMLQTFARTFSGLLLGGSLGVMVGLWLGLSRISDRLLSPTSAPATRQLRVPSAAAGTHRRVRNGRLMACVSAISHSFSA